MSCNIKQIVMIFILKVQNRIANEIILKTTWNNSPTKYFFVGLRDKGGELGEQD